MGDAIEDLRRYRNLRRRRDELIRKARRGGHTQREIARASGLSLDRVREILGRGNPVR